MKKGNGSLTNFDIVVMVCQAPSEEEFDTVYAIGTAVRLDGISGCLDRFRSTVFQI